jgi:hypothetical protein
MAHTPLKMTVEEAQVEFDTAWQASYSPAATERALGAIAHKPFSYRLTQFIARLFFRGIYFPQQGAWAWMRIVAQNWRSVWRLSKEGWGARRAATKLTPVHRATSVKG